MCLVETVRDDINFVKTTIPFLQWYIYIILYIYRPGQAYKLVLAGPCWHWVECQNNINTVCMTDRHPSLKVTAMQQPGHRPEPASYRAASTNIATREGGVRGRGANLCSLSRLRLDWLWWTLRLGTGCWHLSIWCCPFLVYHPVTGTLAGVLIWC